MSESRFKDDAAFLRRMANHRQLDWLIPDRERVFKIANVLSAVQDEIDALDETATDEERQRCNDIVGILWADMANAGLVDERHAKMFDYRCQQIRDGVKF